MHLNLYMDWRNWNPGATFTGANRALQDNLDRDEERILASYALIGAILLFGAIGYAVDWWAGSSPWFLLLGLVLGIFIGFAQLVTRSRRSS
jgi:F0F1-type ATP synthase assembly protein I